MKCRIQQPFKTFIKVLTLILFTTVIIVIYLELVRIYPLQTLGILLASVLTLLLKVTIDVILLTTRNKMTQIWVEKTDKTRGYYREPTREEILKTWFKITIIDCKKDIK